MDVQIPGIPPHHLDRYFGNNIYRSQAVKEEFEKSLNDWHSKLLNWIKSVNLQVAKWNRDVENAFKPEEAVLLRMTPIQANALSPEAISRISDRLSQLRKEKLFMK